MTVASMRNEWWALIGRTMRLPKGWLGLMIVALVVMVAVAGPFLAPHDPNVVIAAPFARAGDDGLLLGADVLGRDALSRVLHGGDALLGMAALSMALSVSAGAVIGIGAAHFGGWMDTVCMRACDVLLAFPQLVFALLLVSVVGPRWWLIVLAIAVAHTPQVARVIRAAALDVCERDFVKASEATGVPHGVLMRRDILPNVIIPLMVEVGLRFTYSILYVAALSFLGLGQQPPKADWGLMINENRLGLQLSVWPVLLPVLLIALITIGANLLTDTLSHASLRIERVPRPHRPALANWRP